MKRAPLSFGIVIGMMVCSAARAADALDAGEISRIVTRGDIHRTEAPNAAKIWVPLYQGNGRFGACYGPWGLHLPEGEKPAYPFRGGTRFTHMKHWVRARYNADYLLPVGTIHWAHEPQDIQRYEQHQSFYKGTITTRFSTPTFSASVVSWFDPVHRNTAGFRIDVEGDAPPIVFAPSRKLSVHYAQQLEASFDGQVEGNVWQATIRCLDRQTPVLVRTTAQLTGIDEGVRIQLKPGRNDVLVTVGTEGERDARRSFEATTQWWREAWGRTAWLDLPDDEAQKVWVRSLAYTLYSHNDDGFGCSPPNGLAGVGWPFPFPFDSGCRHPLLLWTGHVEAAKRWIEFWHSRAGGLRAYTRRLWNRDGMMLPHVFPYGPAEDFHVPEPPNEYYYPLYNAGHLVRMAHQTAAMVNDPQWTARYAAPLIEGAAQFFLDIAKKGDDGLWHFSVNPSIGLDESGGVNQPDYFCTLVSADYALQKAVAYDLDHDGRMAAILRDGIAYRTLLSPEGLYYANAGTGARDFGRQKHPDQFAALVHTPLGPEPDAPTRLCYEKRYEITAEATRPRFLGHTLGEFILCSARMHDADGWRKDWAQVQASKYADPEWVQFYESSGSDLTFYVTTHGVFAQAILETIVSTWWGRLDLASCVPWKGEVRFGRIRTDLGVEVSGLLRDGRGKVILRAWRPATLRVGRRGITLAEGEERAIEVGAAGGTEPAGTSGSK